jgi:16S rRNA (cytosine1402-N4)-methyltransferase
LVCIDRDEEMLEIAKERLKAFPHKIHFYKANFSQLQAILAELGINEVDGILFDLGISSRQIEISERGFSFQSEGPLDMRMDRNQSLTAEDLVNRLSKKELARVFREYGEEPFAERIATAIVERRKRKRISSTRELAEIVEKVVRRRGRIHPATRVFMALRIAVNKELEELRSALPIAISLLKRGGRLCVLSYHSLEDRIVKESFRKRKDELNIITPKPLRPSREEVSINPSARSARLRAAERR